MKLPSIAVVTVVRNSPDALRVTAKNVLEQTYPNLRYYVVDGASTDGTVEVLSDISPLLAGWKSEPDKGIYDAMNKAADMVNEDWIVFMNAGDSFADRNALLKIAECLTSDAAVILGASHKVWKDEYGERVFLERPTDVKDLWWRMPTPHQSVLVRSELQRKYRFDTTYRWCADQDLLVRLMRDDYQFCFSKEVISIFDCAGGQSRKLSLYITERWRISGKVAPWYKRYPAFAMEWSSYLIWGPIVVFIKSLLPKSAIRAMRVIRGTTGK